MNEEQKELEREVKELRVKLMNEEDFEQWTFIQIVEWITNLDNGRFVAYKDVLSASMEEEEIVGRNLYEVNELDIKSWGIKKFDDKKTLMKHIKALIKRYGKDKDVY